MINHILSDDLLVFYITCLLAYFHIKMFVRAKAKIYTILIPLEDKPFWQLHRLDDFINATVNLFIYERLKIPDAYSEASRTYNMEIFARIFANVW